MAYKKKDINVLIVDDDAQICDSVSKILKNEGYSVITANNGNNAISISTQEHIDIALIDIRLPDISGIDVLEKFKQSKPQTGLIIISGVATLDDATRSLNLGADIFLIKPIDPEELLDRIEKVLHQKTLEWRRRESEHRYKTLVENSLDRIIAFGVDFRIGYANPSFAELVGSSKKQITDKSFLDYIYPFSMKLLLNLFETPAEEGGKILPIFFIISKDMEKIPVESSVSMVVRDGVKVGAQMVLRDVRDSFRVE